MNGGIIGNERQGALEQPQRLECRHALGLVELVARLAQHKGGFGRRQRARRRRRDAHRHGHAVASLGDRFDVVPGLRTGERLAQRRDMDGQVAVFDDDFRPQLSIEGLAIDQPAAGFEQESQHVQRLARHSDPAALACQLTFGRVERERTKLVQRHDDTFRFD